MSKTARYQGPLALDQAKSKFVLTPLEDNRFHRDGPRANVEYRDLGMAEASGAASAPSTSALSSRSARRPVGIGTT